MTQKLEIFWLWIISQVSNIETSFLEVYGELGEILDIPNRSLAPEMQPIEVGDFSKNPDLPPRFFAEIHGLGQKVSQGVKNAYQLAKVFLINLLQF